MSPYRIPSPMPAEIPETKPFKMRSFLFGVLVLCGTAAIFSTEACTKQQTAQGIQVTQTGFQCAVDIATLIITGNEDPTAVATSCGLTLVQLIALLDSIASPSDAGAADLHYTPVQLAAFAKVRDAAVARYAMSHKIAGACTTVVVAGTDAGAALGK